MITSRQLYQEEPTPHQLTVNRQMGKSQAPLFKYAKIVTIKSWDTIEYQAVDLDTGKVVASEVVSIYYPHNTPTKRFKASEKVRKAAHDMGYKITYENKGDKQ